MYRFEKGIGFGFGQRQVSSSVQPVSRGMGISAHVKNRPIKTGVGTATGTDEEGGQAAELNGNGKNVVGSLESNGLSLNSSQDPKKQKEMQARTRSVEYNPNDSGYFKER